MADAFAKRHVKPLGLSTDGVEEHLKWIEDVNDTQETTVSFPIVADPDCIVARLYEMIHPHESETAAVRSVFIIDPHKKIRLTMTYPMNVGRNFDEILRWTGGRIYNPDDGTDYGAQMSIQDDSTLRVRAYVLLPALGKTQIWARVH